MPQSQRSIAVVLIVCSLLTASIAHAQTPALRLTMRDGRVTLSAHDVPIAELLREWSRVGQTRIVNGDQMPATRVTIDLADVNEREALEIILRSAAGFIAVPRPSTRPGPSAYDRVAILVSSRAVTASPINNPAANLPQAVEAAGNDAPLEEISFDAAEAAPLTPAQPPVIAPMPGLHPQLEGAQPRGVKLSDLIRDAQRRGPGQ